VDLWTNCRRPRFAVRLSGAYTIALPTTSQRGITASKRAHETGRIVIHFTVKAAGLAQEPFILDEEESTTYPRLIETARKMLRGRKFQIGPRYKTKLTASFVFENMPCGKLSQGPVVD